jgi:hypothetical protein
MIVNRDSAVMSTIVCRKGNAPIKCLPLAAIAREKLSNHLGALWYFVHHYRYVLSFASSAIFSDVAKT